MTLVGKGAIGTCPRCPLQRQIRREPQLNRQMAMNGEARAMKQQLQELKKHLEDKI